MGYGVVRLRTYGAIDTTFGTNGGAFVGFSGFPMVNAYALVIQSNGDVVVSGDAVLSTASNAPADFALARFTSQGTVDTTFGSGGKITTTFGSGTTAFVTSLAIQSNGNLSVAGVDGAQLRLHDITNPPSDSESILRNQTIGRGGTGQISKCVLHR